jgi:lipoprotein NlpI
MCRHMVGVDMFLKALLFACLGQAQTSTELLNAARTAWAEQDLKRALDLANQALAADPKNKLAYILRGSLYEEKEAYLDAARDWSKVIELDPKDSDAYQARGCLYFKASRFDDSLADFDKHLELRPERRKSHWQRGITCYYAGKFDEGKRQFEVYQDFDSADVENAIWRFMCMVRVAGLKKAQAEMLKIGDDRRVPMRDIYELYIGKKTPADVLAAAAKGDLKPEQKNRQLFYAHLYLGIWFDLMGDRDAALEHLNKAADDHRIGHYMWDVARVHRDRLTSPKK